jgi:hypothetical protein
MSRAGGAEVGDQAGKGSAAGGELHIIGDAARKLTDLIGAVWH